jgi:hypothetical protein
MGNNSLMIVAVPCSVASVPGRVQATLQPPVRSRRVRMAQRGRRLRATTHCAAPVDWQNMQRP